MTIRLYDTTLRDGTQREGLSLSVEDKLKIARALDRLGVSYIEGGWPGSNPKDADFFRRIREVPLAHARDRRLRQHPPSGHPLRGRRQPPRPRSPPRRPSSRSSARARPCTWIACSRRRRDENLRMIGESVAFLKAAGRGGDLRRGALLRRLRPRPGIRARHPRCRRRGRRRLPRALRYERRRATRRRARADLPRPRPPADSGRHPPAQRRRPRRGQRARRRAGRRGAGPGHHQRLW